MSVRGVLGVIGFKEENNATKLIEMDLGILSLDVILPGLRYSRLLLFSRPAQHVRRIFAEAVDNVYF